MITIYIILYCAIVGASIFGLTVAGNKHTGIEDNIGWVLCGIFWPVALLPAIGYIAAGWYLNRD